jgi:hypothetical protein
METTERVARALSLRQRGTENAWRSFLDDAMVAIDAMQEWRPIASAPKDGTSVLLATPSGRLADGMWGNYKVWVWPYVMVEPTHWMERPEPPK